MSALSFKGVLFKESRPQLTDLQPGTPACQTRPLGGAPACTGTLMHQALSWRRGRTFRVGPATGTMRSGRNAAFGFSPSLVIAPPPHPPVPQSSSFPSSRTTFLPHRSAAKRPGRGASAGRSRFNADPEELTDPNSFTLILWRHKKSIVLSSNTQQEEEVTFDLCSVDYFAVCPSLSLSLPHFCATLHFHYTFIYLLSQ